MKQLLKKLMNLFSLGGSNTVDLEEKNRLLHVKISKIDNNKQDN